MTKSGDKSWNKRDEPHFFPNATQPQRDPQPFVTSDLEHTPRFVPSLSRRKTQTQQYRYGRWQQKSAPKSNAFWILTYKIFVVNILRGISPVVVGKLLIPDILKK